MLNSGSGVGIQSYDEYLALINTDELALQFSLVNGLIDQHQHCECGKQMTMQTNREKKHGLQFVCSSSRTVCHKKRSILARSFFSHVRLPMSSALKCIAGYAAGLSNEQLAFYTGLRSSRTTVDWQNFFRDICSSGIQDFEEVQIGGVGMTVEIDESLVFKRKNHVGRLLSNEIAETWMFGGICRETGDAFVVPVPDRSAATLLSQIDRNIAAGTRIISDCWKGYRNLTSEGYNHATVNHSKNFIDPADPSIHTQKIERMWRTLKSVIPKGTSEELKWTYLAEFVFKARTKWFSLSIGQRIVLIVERLRNIGFE